MKILLAPAETKLDGGYFLPLKQNIFAYAHEVIGAYETYVLNSSIEELSVWFGLKKIQEVKKYKRSILNLPTMKAIKRYVGVAFEAIDYTSLDDDAKKYIDENVMIFSNLFGILRADDLIPDYKWKQGAILPNLNTEKFYKEFLKEKLDEYLGEEILDLAPTYYQKFYKPISNVIRYKFLKDGKVVSHWAKHYRGKMVREIAKNNIKNFKELMDFKFEGLLLYEIQQKKNIKTIIMNIED